MAKSGEFIENPAIGDRIVFRKTAQETKGELLEFEMFVQPSAAGPPLHIHPKFVFLPGADLLRQLKLKPSW
jgi:hypothetical protein